MGREILNVYACRTCEHIQTASQAPLSCEKCGGSLSIVHGVQVVEDGEEETKKYAHELSRT